MQATAESFQLKIDPESGTVRKVNGNGDSFNSLGDFFFHKVLEQSTSLPIDETKKLDSFIACPQSWEVIPFSDLNTNESFIEIKKWEGKIISIDMDKEIFWAEVRDTAEPEVEEETYFSFDEVNENDRKLISEGAIIYWSIGYKRTASGTREKVSILLFRRLPAWKIDQGKIENEVDALSKLLSDE
jgi:hypothetical protein